MELFLFGATIHFTTCPFFSEMTKESKTKAYSANYHKKPPQFTLTAAVLIMRL
jgi:hypothetical protein